MFGVALTLLGLSFFSSLTVQASICQLQTAPAIIVPITNITTTNINYVLDGTADQNTTVAIFDNGQEIGTVTPDNTNSFEIDVPISQGLNSFNISSSNSCNTTTSNYVTITRSVPVVTPSVSSDTAPQPAVTQTVTSQPSVISSEIPTIGVIKNQITSPAVLVTNPTPNVQKTLDMMKKLSITITGIKKTQTTTANSLFIAGSTTLSSNLRVEDNGVDIGSLSQFTFSTAFGFTIPLKNGNNVITISAKNGTSETHETITVKKSVQTWYQDPSTQKAVVLSALFIIIVTGSMILL
jgi:hypothetical protein